MVRAGNISAWAQYSVLCSRREAVLDALKEAKVPTAIYYPKPLHVQGAYAYLGYAADDFPVCMESAAGIFSLPMHPYLEERDQAMIADAIQKAYK